MVECAMHVVLDPTFHTPAIQTSTAVGEVLFSTPCEDLVWASDVRIALHFLELDLDFFFWFCVGILPFKLGSLCC